MAGFGNVFGFIISFMILLGFFTSAFYMYEVQLSDQIKILESSKQEILLRSENYGFELSEPYFSSGKLRFSLLTDSKEDFILKMDQDECFSVFVNELFFGNANSLRTHINKNLAASYDIKEVLDSAYVVIDYSSYSSALVKASSCGGFSTEFDLDSASWDWFDDDFSKRKTVEIEELSGNDLGEYQFLVEFNSSVIDFTEFKEEEVEFVYDLKNSIVADFSFDTYLQSLEDSSRFTQSATLGVTSAAGTDDPSFTKDSIFFGALGFDGVDDFVQISADTHLALEEQLSFVAWVKPDFTGSSTYFPLVTNGADSNQLGIINDGGANQGKVSFRLSVDSTQYELVSSSALENSKWQLVAGVYDGASMKVYVDGALSANISVSGDVDSISGINYLGRDAGGDYLKGDIDEVKVYSLALTQDEVYDLFVGEQGFRKLDFFTSYVGESKAEFYVKFPFLFANSNDSFAMYYDSTKLESSSNIYETFSYLFPRTTSYVVSDLSVANGLELLSLADNSLVSVGDDSFSLDKLSTSSLAPASLTLGDEIKMSNLVSIERGGDGGEMVVPISWAGTEFTYRGFRNGNDEFCMMAPFGDANVEIRDNSALEWSGVITSTPTCQINDIGTNNNLKITSDVPILVSYHGSAADSFVMYPATSKSLLGVPSNSFYVAAGTGGSDVTIYRSSSSSISQTISEDGTYSVSGTGSDGSGDAYLIDSTGIIGAVGQADTDGLEIAVLAPSFETGKIFGGSFDMQYLVFASRYSDANCSLYDSTGTLDSKVEVGTGTGDRIFKYGFGNVGADSFYLAAPWYVSCDKPVWGYYEKDSPDTDETNLFGYLQMKQYTWPEPSVSIN